jgi:multidrug resistance efflux pump
VKKGDKLAQLDISALRAELLHGQEDRQAANGEVEKYRGMGDPASEQIAMTKVRAADQKIKRLEQDIAAGTLLAPFDGIVLTKDIELSEGVYVSPGTDFAVIGSTDKWDLQVHLQEKQVGKVENLMEEKPEVEVHFILYSANSEPLSGLLKDRNQLSQVAYPHQRENALQENSFVLTLRDIQAPKEIRRTFRPDLTGRASFMWGRNIAQWFRLKWVW